jgi:glycosyltransferase involved in cell wall biosynthesis
MAAAINQLLADETLRRRMSAAALARAQSDFNVTIMTARMLDLYENVLSAKKA